MALSETLTETSICNQALGRIGAKQIGNVETDTSVPAIQCRLHYEQTRDSLIRSYTWRFASGRATLVEDTEVDEDFEWSVQFTLPTDLMFLTSIYEGRFSGVNFRNYAIEGKRLLTNETTMEIRYVKKVTDVLEFDSLFVKVLILLLADVLIGPLAGGDPRIQNKIDRALAELMPSVRALDGQETNTAGRLESSTWNDARHAGRDPSRL